MAVTIFPLADLTNGSIDRTDFSNIHWRGSAILDVLLKTVNDNLLTQYESGRITGTDYAKVYYTLVEACIREAMGFFIQKPMTEQQITSMKIDDGIKQTQSTQDLLIKQQEVLNKQAQTELLNKQGSELLLNGAAERASKTAQTALYVRQKQGFDDNKLQKLFEATMNGWALAYSSGMMEASDVPTIVKDANITNLFNTIKVGS